ncbi:hypothetical protein LguiB_025581 [Lonicera macranthoides]
MAEVKQNATVGLRQLRLRWAATTRGDGGGVGVAGGGVVDCLGVRGVGGDIVERWSKVILGPKQNKQGVDVRVSLKIQACTFRIVVAAFL